MHGTIRWFNRAKAYGFIAPDDGGDDVFVRLDEAERAALGALAPGDPVTFRVVQGSRGPEARYLALGHLPDDDMA
ncbi:MAG: cold-shock protein [Alphaproteobacteria bacterium]